LTDATWKGPIHPVATVEQRARERSRVWLPGRLRSDAGETLAVTYDASAKGVLMLAAKALPVGARVTLLLELPVDPPRERTATGRVVRAEPNREDPDGLWPHRIAVVLDEAMEALGAEIEALARAHPLHAKGK
jgi:hypothetical protein